jgi:phosphoglycolate phosphatase
LQFDGVIFDLDGTLANTLEDLADAMNRVLAERRLPVHGYGWYREAIGNGIRRLVGDALPPGKRTEATTSACFAAMMAEYGARCLVKTHLYDGIAELVSRLRADGVRLAVFSNKADELTQRVVDGLIEPGTFDVVMGAQPGVPLKPDPAGALLVGNRLGIAPGRIVYLGDTGIDMLTATRAGMIAVGVSWGFRTEAELRENGAMAMVGHPLELLALRSASGP